MLRRAVGPFYARERVLLELAGQIACLAGPVFFKGFAGEDPARRFEKGARMWSACADRNPFQSKHV